MNRFLMAVAVAGSVTASVTAFAQQDANNPAPSYSATPPVQNQQVKHIEDGVNAAPRYPTVAPVKSAKVSPIQDANNPAPVAQSASTAQKPQARRAKASARTLHARQHAHAANRG